MKLQEGAYENLITHALQSDMRQAATDGLVCKEDDIDEAESPLMLAEHVRKMVCNRLSDENLSAEERVDFVNRLIDFLGEEKEDKIADEHKMLSAVVSRQEDARLRATSQAPVRPLTGFRISNLFTGGQSKVPLNAEIERDIESADNIYLIVSFLKLSGLNTTG